MYRIVYKSLKVGAAFSTKNNFYRYYNTMANYPVFKFIVKEDGNTTGMLGMSVVDGEAMEIGMQNFEKVEAKPQFITLQEEDGEDKQELLGVALRADFPILRKDDVGNFYYGIFEKDTIEVIRNKFHKEKKNLSTVNLNHDSEKEIDAYLIESYIIQTEEQLSGIQALGLSDEIGIGDWIVRYKIEDKEIYDFAVENLTGFSIEILLERELVDEFNKNNFKQNKSIMSKVEKLVGKFKEAIEQFEETPETTPETPATEVTLEDVTVAESGRVLRYTEVGAPVMEITTDEEGAETEVAFTEAAELILEDGRTIVIDEDGNLAEIKDAEEEVAPVAEEDMAEETPAEETPAPAVEEVLEDAPAEEAPVVETETGLPDAVKTWLNQIAGDFEDGDIYLSFYKDGGEMTYGSVSTWANIKMSEETLAKVEKLEKEVATPVAAPVFTQFGGEDGKIKKSKAEFKNNLDYTLHRLNLEDA